jgi:DNA-binding CsgD family transcriptional regulator
MSMQELRHVVLPYQAEALTERAELAGRATEALRREGGMTTTWDLPARLPCLPLLAIEGKWVEARMLAKSRLTGPWQGLCQGVLATLAHAQGDTGLAWATVRAALPAGPATEPGGDDCREALPLQRLAATLALEAVDLPAAHAWLAAHDRWLTWSGTVLGRAEETLGWAAYHRAAGDAAQAREHADAALVHASDPRQPLALLATHRLLGELDIEEGRFAAAEQHLVEAMNLAEACAAPYERLLTLLALAGLRRATGDRAAALRLGQEARDIGRALGAAPSVARAEALLAALAVVSEDTTAYPAGLSAREVEILRHVAAGRPNRDIAEALSLSEHTMRAHIRHIFAKTGADNRAAATAFAFRHRLT